MTCGTLRAKLGEPMKPVVFVFAVIALGLGGCSKVVKQEGFRATLSQTDDPKLECTYEGLGAPSCGRFQPDRREVHLQADRFVLDVIDEPFSGKERTVELVIDGESFVADRPGAESTLVVDAPKGRIIGSLTATLVHASAGTMIDGRPAPIRQVRVDLTFNLQPCL